MSEQHPDRAIIPPVPEGTPRPLWSVMIPTYNCANYLRETLASVLAQDPGREIMQIEVIDDRSTEDNPRAVVEELGRGRVSFYQQPKNVGHIRNFETCLQRARGSLIHLLHGDDCVRDGFYGKMQKAFDARLEIGAAFCRHMIMDEHSHWQNISQLEQPESGILSNWLERIASFQHIQTPSIVVRREVYEVLGGFDSRLCWTEDWEMWVRIAANYLIWYEVEPLAVYRKHSASNTGRNMRTGENLRDVRRAINIFQSYLSNTSASKIANKARENWALYSLNFIAPQLLTSGNMADVIAQIPEALKCSYSLKVILAIFDLLKSVGKLWLLENIRTVIYLLRRIVSHIMEFYVRPPILRNTIKHIYGKNKIQYAKDELIVLCVVKNGEVYIKSFIEHYLLLGVKHIVFLFNDSTDNSIAIASQYENVTILETECKFKKYENVMRRYLIYRFSKNRWNVFADIDELFDYPFSDLINLSIFLNYLNNKRYTAVVAQMLDLFSDISLASVTSRINDSLKEMYRYYDISNLKKETYPFGELSNKNINLHWGGIRKTLFGTDNGLTKPALIFVDRKIRTFVHCHHVKHARIADFSCVLLHYPFTSFFYEKVMDAVKTRRYLQSADHEYTMYWDRLKRDPDLNIKQPTACKLENLNCLVEKDFLVVSEDYITWVKNHSNIAIDSLTEKPSF